MTDFEKIAHLVRFGLPFQKITQTTIINWADNKIMETNCDEIFFDLATATNSNKIVEILSTKVDWDFKNNAIRQLILSYYREYLKMNSSNWFNIDAEILDYFTLIEYDNSNDRTDDFLYYLGDDYSLRQEGYGGLLSMPDYLEENLRQYNSYNDLQNLLTKNGLTGYNI
jgi:hypothetical protein